MTKITVFGGAGAVGGFLVSKMEHIIAGGRAASKQPVALTVVCRPSTVQSIEQRGYFLMKETVTNTEVKSNSFKLCSTSDTASVGHQDYLISCLKGHQIAESVESLMPLIGPDTCLVTLQNGLPFWHNHAVNHPALKGTPLESIDPGGRLFHSIPAENLAGCVCQIAAEKLEPGVIQLNVRADKCLFFFGEALSGPSPRLQALADILNSAGINSFVEEDFLNRIWTKLRISTAFNTTNVLTAGFMDDMVRNDDMIQLNKSIVDEVMTVGTTFGITFPDTLDEMIAVAQGRFPHSKFSMLQDAEGGREMEISPYVTAVQEVATKVGVSMPVYNTVATLLKHYADNMQARK